MEIINNREVIKRLDRGDDPLEVMATFMFSLGWIDIERKLRNTNYKKGFKGEMAFNTVSEADRNR